MVGSKLFKRCRRLGVHAACTWAYFGLRTRHRSSPHRTTCRVALSGMTSRVLEVPSGYEACREGYYLTCKALRSATKRVGKWTHSGRASMPSTNATGRGGKVVLEPQIPLRFVMIGTKLCSQDSRVESDEPGSKIGFYMSTQ